MNLGSRHTDEAKIKAEFRQDKKFLPVVFTIAQDLFILDSRVCSKAMLNQIVFRMLSLRPNLSFVRVLVFEKF